MKIIIKVEMPDKEKSAAAVKKKPSLEERIEYAIDCIAADCHKKRAIEFLQNLKSKMEAVDKPTKEFQVQLEKVTVALSDYGHYHIKS